MKFKEGDMIIYPEGDIWICKDAERWFFQYVGGGTPSPHWRGVQISFGTNELLGASIYPKQIKSNKPEWF